MADRITPASPAQPPRPLAAQSSTPALVIATLSQTASNWAIFALAPAASTAARELGAPATAIGWQITIVFLLASPASLLAGRVCRRLGAGRAMALALGLHAVGAILCAAGLVGAAIGSALMGLGYALVNPAGAALLAATSPKRRNLLFSIKQMSVPAGVLAAGLATPYLTEAIDWRAAPAAAGLVCALGAALVLRTAPNPGAAPPRGSFWRDPFDPLRYVLRHRALFWLSLGALSFGMAQTCLMTYASPYFVEDLGMSLAAAGGFLSIASLGGALGRPFWGAIADRFAAPEATLVGVGLVVALAALATLAATPETSPIALGFLMFVFGGSAIAWNGVFVSHIVTLSGPERAAEATGGVLVFAFASSIIAPGVFSLLVPLLGGFGPALAFCALYGLGGSLGLMLCARARRRAAV